MIVQKINLNLIPNGVMPRVNVSQYDYGSRTLEITLYNGSTLFSIPSGAQVIIQGTKKDNRGFQYLDLDYTGSVVTADITQQMTVFEDEVQIELVIITGSGDNKQQLATANFILNVEAAALKDDIVVSETDIPAIQNLPEAMAEVDYAVELLEEALPSIESSIKDAEAWAVGTKNGSPVESTDIQYRNNSKYYSQQAATSAANVIAMAYESEAYAVGKRNGIPVDSGDVAYENNSKFYAENASTSASNAATSESNANTLAISAATSAQDASASAVNAATSETNAAVSDTNAAASATSAANSATNAANSASSASTSATNAATSASNAATSETNAATSEANASTSETNAATSETNASNSALDSEAWAVGKRNGVDVASTDDTYENNSKYYSVQSGLSATASANSATASANSATSAENSSLDSEAWSVGERNGTPVEYGDETYHNNAKYWAGQAEQAAGGGVISFSGRNGYVEPQAGDYTKAMVGLGNVDNTADLDKPISTATSTALANKMPLVTGQQGQVIGFDSQGNPVAQTVPSSGHVIVDEDGVSYPYRNKLKFENSEVEDDATNDTTIVTPRGGTTIVKKPTVTVGTYTYNGQPQGATITWDTGMSQHCVITNATQTNAGTYTLTIALKNTATMVWNDLTTANLTYTYTISPKSVTVPTVSGAYTYDTTEKSAVVGSYDTDEIIQGGTDSATVVGTYTITFDLASANYVWSDSTTSQKSATWSISKATLTVPTVTNTSKTYNGSSQSPTITGFNSTTMTKSGDSATNAGSYTVSFALVDTDNYQWDNSTTSFSWSIGKATITLPSVTNTSKTYNGSSQSPTIGSYDSTKLTVSGNSATNAGNYTVVFALVDSDNYQMSGTNNVAWSIAKADQSITLSSYSVTLDSSHTTATVTVSGNQGSISASSSNTGVVTVSVGGNAITMVRQGSSSGTATVTVTAESTTNYNSATKTISVATKFYRTMTIKIDQSNSNPATCCTYYDDAVGMTAGSSAWDDFFGEVPVLLNSSGTELGELNPNNYAQYKNGTSAPITTIGNDVMVKFPKRGLKISTSGNIVTVSMTDNPSAESAGFKYYAHSYGANNNCDAVYVGAYKGYVSSSKLYSSSGKTPTGNQTIGTFRTQANARGTGYEQITFYVRTFLVAAYLLKYKHLNSQVAVGKGYVYGNSAPTTTGQTNAKGMNWGETTGKYQCKCLGVEDLWGNINEWIDGIFSNSTRNILTKTTNNSMNDTGSGYTDQGQGATTNIENYLSAVQGTTEKGFVVKAVSGSATTYFCDYGALYDSMVACVGGVYLNDSVAGVFFCDVSRSALEASVYVGGRLIKFKVAS